MAKHTPGPWTANLGYTPTVTVGDTLLCVPSAPADELGGRHLSELTANARLIAAAPDYHQAVAELLALWPLGGYELEAYMDATFIPAAMAARAKAKGE